MSFSSDVWSAIAEHPWATIVDHLLLSVVTPGVVAAFVTAAIQRKRADLQMVKIHPTKYVADWLARAKTDQDAEGIKGMQNWEAADIVLLTNYGNGTAHDIRLSGTNCRPRVFVRDTAGLKLEEEDDDKALDALPMWSNRYPALEPGKEWSLVVMSRTDKSGDRPALEVSWRGLEWSWSWRRPLRWPIRLRRTRPFDLATANMIETGWPGKSKMATDPD